MSEQKNIIQKAGIIKKIFDFRETTILLILLFVGVLMSFLSPYFLNVGNMRTTLIGLSADSIIAIGMTIALVSGGFDLSVGSMVGFSGAIAAALFAAGFNIWLAVILAIAAGTSAGFINGMLIGKLGLNPFITTLAMLSMARGAAYVITSGSPISVMHAPESFTFLGRGAIFGLPLIILIFVVFAIVSDFMLRKSSPLRKVFYTGSNEKAAILSGIDTKKVKILVYTLSAFLASFTSSRR